MAFAGEMEGRGRWTGRMHWCGRFGPSSGPAGSSGVKMVIVRGCGIAVVFACKNSGNAVVDCHADGC